MIWSDIFIGGIVLVFLGVLGVLFMIDLIAGDWDDDE